MKKILFFTADFGEANIAFAHEHGLTMRNVAAYYVGDTLENADAVCGDVPDAYLARYPVFDLPEPEALDVKKLTVDKLKNELAARGVVFDDHAKKDELVALLEAALGNE